MIVITTGISPRDFAGTRTFFSLCFSWGASELGLLSFKVRRVRRDVQHLNVRLFACFPGLLRLQPFDSKVSKVRRKRIRKWFGGESESVGSEPVENEGRSQKAVLWALNPTSEAWAPAIYKRCSKSPLSVVSLEPQEESESLLSPESQEESLVSLVSLA